MRQYTMLVTSCYMASDPEGLYSHCLYAEPDSPYTGGPEFCAHPKLAGCKPVKCMIGIPRRCPLKKAVKK